MRRPKEPPEDSVRLRLIVGALVMVSVVAVVAQGALDPATAAGALVVVPAGYVFSYFRRRRSNVGVKVALAFGLLLALGAFLQRMRLAQTVDEARMPLASLFVWVQALHAFDVPRRRDLAFSVVSSVILMAEAASLSFGTGLILLLVPWTALAAAWLYATQRPAGLHLDSPRFVRRVSGRSGAGRALSAASVGASSTSLVLVGVLAAFLVTPRLPGTYVRLPPFALGAASLPVASFDGSVSNPGLPAAGGDGVVDFSPVAYPGFGSRVDLRARGRLSDRLAMLVRSPQPALWRGQVYDTFDGTTWTESDTSTSTRGQEADRSFSIPPAADGGEVPPAGTNHIVTTFYVRATQPNIVFAAYAPERVFFPAAQLVVGPGTSLRSPILLDRGLVYSVVSDVPVTTPGSLRAATGTLPPDVIARYTQLPAELPGRDVRLAEHITAGATTEYDRVMAVQTWLRAHTVYDLNVPRDPPGVDAVDEFLFERRRGFCEHIASAMVVLLRSVGVPARFVTGFGPGQRNPLTGYLEVRESDAHAWVEVLYPGSGWVPYDPTFGVPSADPGSAWFVGPDVLRALGRWASGVVPAPVRNAFASAGRALGASAGVALERWPALAAALTAAGALMLLRPRRRAHGPPRTGAAAAFDALTRATAARGLPRRAHQTPSEYLRALEAHDRVQGGEVLADAERVVRAFERERFSAEPPSADEVAEAVSAARRVDLALRGSR